MFLTNNSMETSSATCQAVRDNRGCLYFSLLWKTGLRLVDSLQKRRFQLNVRNGLAPGAFNSGEAVGGGELPVFGKIPEKARCTPVRDAAKELLHGLGDENIHDYPTVFCGVPGFLGYA